MNRDDPSCGSKLPIQLRQQGRESLNNLLLSCGSLSSGAPDVQYGGEKPLMRSHLPSIESIQGLNDRRRGE